MNPLSKNVEGRQRTWKSLAAYYRQSLEREQMQRLQLSLEAKGYALLREITDQLITQGAPEALLTSESDLQQVRQLLARKEGGEEQALFYAFPLVRQQRTLIPVCYTEVRAEPGQRPGTLVLRRQGELLVNRRFLLESADLTDAEVTAFARRLGTGLDELLVEGELTRQAMLFRADPDVVTRNLLRELEWMERQPRLSAPLNAYLQGEPIHSVLPPTPGITVVRSNPAQERVLKNRASTLQVVSGPPGTGKTQTIINLIASAVCDGQTVLFISKNNTAVDNVYAAFRKEELFPGILRLGNQSVRASALDHLREVLARLPKAPVIAAQTEEFAAKGAALTREIARLEEELTEVRRQLQTRQERFLLLQRTEEQLREGGLYRFATDLASSITAATAERFRPEQLIGLRRLGARTANWIEEPEGLWLRLLDRVGLLSRHRLSQLERWVKELDLPASCRIEGEALEQRLNGLLRMEAIYPFLLATSRHLCVQADLVGKRSPAEIEADLASAHVAKIAHDRSRLTRHWEGLAQTARPKAARLQELLTLFERFAEGTADTETRKLWWRRYGELLTLFPVICSTNLSLASAAPNELERFDLAILDEASQSDIASFLPALYRARRACVVGDDQQLRHISNLGAEEDERLMATAGLQPGESLSYHQDSAFDRAMAVAGRSAHTLLDRHYRSVPEIIEFCNRHFYGGRLRVERASLAGPALPGGLPSSGFILDEVRTGQTSYRSSAASKSAFNPIEAARVLQLVRQYIAAGWSDIGVVTPFRAQRALLHQLREAMLKAEPDPSIRAALSQVELGTIHTFQGGQHQLMLFSPVVAPGAREGTIRWFDANRNLLNVAISRAKDLLIVVGHRGTLFDAGGILRSMVTYAENLARPSDQLPPLPPGLQPERLGLLPSERELLQSWLSPPGAIAEVLNKGEQVLYQKLTALLAGRPVLLAPKMRVLDSLEPSLMPALTQPERDYAFRAHFDLVLVDQRSFRPIAAVELDGRQHQTDPLTQARDRLKDGLCGKAGLPLVRVRWDDWGQLGAVEALLGRTAP